MADVISSSTKADLIKKATGFSVPDEKTTYTAEVAIQKNVLLIGKSGGGKSTLFEVLKKPLYVTTSETTLFAGARLKAEYAPLVVRNGEGKAYSINVIDTPGLFEVRSNPAEKRSNRQIFELMESCLREKVTTISAVFLVIPVSHVFTEEDLETLNQVSSFLGDGFKKNTMIVFSQADTYQLDALQGRISEFLSSPVSLPFINFCQGGIYFTGAVSGESVSEYGEAYETKAKKKVICLRQHLIDAVIACSDVHLPEKFWPGPSAEPVKPDTPTGKPDKPTAAEKPSTDSPAKGGSTASKKTIPVPDKKKTDKS